MQACGRNCNELCGQQRSANGAPQADAGKSAQQAAQQGKVPGGTAIPRSLVAQWSLKPKAVVGVQAAAAFQLPVHSKVIAIHDQMLDDRGGSCVNVDVGNFHSCAELGQKAKQLSHPFEGSSA